MGDHTDYTRGLVMPIAINMGITVTFYPENSATLYVTSSKYQEEVVIPLGGEKPALAELMSFPKKKWERYVMGVLAVLNNRVGGKVYIESDLPVGAGLSSSASLEVGVALALGYSKSKKELALACQQAEHLATGVPCGIMDQMASVFGKTDQALLINCYNLEVSYIELPSNIEILVVHSGQDRKLENVNYTQRYEECKRAEAIIGPLNKAGVEDLKSIKDPTIKKRARHVITENARVLETAKQFSKQNLASLGKLFKESHISLDQDYQVSTDAVNDLVYTLEKIPGVIGVRLTGGGFGGCVVAIVEKSEFSFSAIPHNYSKNAWIVKPSSGAELRER